MIRNIKLITASSFLAMLFMGVGSALIGAAARDIGLTAAQIGVLIAVQNLGFVFSVIVAGALADTRPKPKILFIGSLILGISFLTFYLVPSFWVNLAIMLLSGIGLGTYEGVADAMLLDLHEARAALFINVNHFFVTIGALAISLYLIFLRLNWRVGGAVGHHHPGAGGCLQPDSAAAQARERTPATGRRCAFWRTRR